MQKPLYALLLMLFWGTVSLLFVAPAHAAPSAALVIDAATGRYLYADAAHSLRYPASITKVMTLYLTFEALRDKRITTETLMTVSARAANRPPSRLGLRAGQTLSVHDAVLALITKSANDAASVLAEHLGGTEEAFAQQMTRRAQAMGMKDSRFFNASGLPDTRQVTTARDLSVLAVRLMRDFPRYYPLFARKEFIYQGKVLRNHNKLLGKMQGLDGLKTGFTVSSGFNLLASCRRGNVRLIGVVFGGETGAARDKRMVKILEQGFASMQGAAEGAKPAVTMAPIAQ